MFYFFNNKIVDDRIKAKIETGEAKNELEALEKIEGDTLNSSHPELGFQRAIIEARIKKLKAQQ